MGGVLVDLNPKRCIEAFEKIGAHEIAKYVEEARTEDLFRDIETGEMTTWDFCQEVRRMTGSQARNEDIIWAWCELLDGIDQEKLRRLVELKKDFRIFLLSNTNEMHWLYCAENFFPYRQYVAEDYFEHIFLSYEMHKVKPNLNIYEQVLAEAGLDPTETLFIDDSLRNLEGAQLAGIQTFHETEGHRWVELL